ncbi:Uncharacterised protein [Mycobacteroides abscessus]|nr:Uncharacterised protein [Mycobacteroides abscessus]
MAHIGLEGGSAGDVHLEAVGHGLGIAVFVCREFLDDVADGFDRFVGKRLAHVTGEVHLDVGGLAVGALCAGLGQRIAPEILYVLNVFGVGT